MSDFCLFTLDMVDALGREWCLCRRLRTHEIHTPPNLPDGAAELTARITGDHERDDLGDE